MCHQYISVCSAWFASAALDFVACTVIVRFCSQCLIRIVLDWTLPWHMLSNVGLVLTTRDICLFLQFCVGSCIAACSEVSPYFLTGVFCTRGVGVHLECLSPQHFLFYMWGPLFLVYDPYDHNCLVFHCVSFVEVFLIGTIWIWPIGDENNALAD